MFRLVSLRDDHVSTEVGGDRMERQRRKKKVSNVSRSVSFCLNRPAIEGGIKIKEKIYMYKNTKTKTYFGECAVGWFIGKLWSGVGVLWMHEWAILLKEKERKINSVEKKSRNNPGKCVPQNFSGCSTRERLVAIR